MPADDEEEVNVVAEGEDQKLREKQWDENEPLRHLCRYNRITKLKFVQSADLYEQLEVFQEMVFELSSAMFFPNLVELWVMDQAYTVKNLQGLENCSKLRVLNVTQCDLTSLDGLETLTNLRKLIVHSNKLTSLLGVQPLINLEELVVHSNQIRFLDGVEKLASSLKHLEVGANPIQVLDPVLGLKKLRVLNVAGTKIGSFYEILKLSVLPQLEDLYFGDPHFGTCPVCYLCNYQTYVLYHLPQLRRLDSIPLVDEAKKGALSTYVKKKMYYNMRIKTVQRDGVNVVLYAARMARAFERDLHRHTVVLHRNLRVLKQSQARVRFSRQQLVGVDSSAAEPSADAAAADLADMVARVEEQLVAWRRHVRGYDALVAELGREVKMETEDMISRLMLELETGGNIRLEDGSERDLWYKSCSDLLKSRFNKSNFTSALSTSGVSRRAPVETIRINRVSRIHNRLLRNGFEMRLNEIMQKVQHAKRLLRTKAGVKYASKSAITPIEELAEMDIDFSLMEYLFYDSAFHKTGRPQDASTATCGKELFYLVQTGVSGRGSRPVGDAASTAAAAQAQGAQKREAFVNDVAAVENGWIEAGFSNKNGMGSGTSSTGGSDMAADALPPALPTFEPNAEGELVVCKVFVGRCRNKSDGASNGEVNGAARQMEIPETFVEPLDMRARAATSPRGSTHDGVESGATQPQRWLVNDLALVLPEYLVQYEMVRNEGLLEGDSLSAGGAGAQSDFTSRLAATSVFERPTVPSAGLAKPFRRLLQLFLEKCECLHTKLVSECCLDGERVLDDVAEFLPEAAFATMDDPDLSHPRYTLHDPDDSTISNTPCDTSNHAGGRADLEDLDAARPASSAGMVELIRQDFPTSAVRAATSVEAEVETRESKHGEDEESSVGVASDCAADAATSTKSMGEIAVLSLIDRGIQSLPVFDFVAGTALVVLDLSFNAIRALPRGVLLPLTGLRELHLDFNFLEALQVENQGLNRLSKLSLVCNRISEMEEVSRLGRACPHLLELNLLDNPLTKLRGYVGGVIRRLPHIAVLDGLALDAKRGNQNEVARIQRLIKDVGVTGPSPGAHGSTGEAGGGPSAFDGVGSAPDVELVPAPLAEVDFRLRSVRVPYGQAHQVQRSAGSEQAQSHSRGSAEARAEAEASALVEQELARTDNCDSFSPVSSPTGGLARFYASVVRLDLSNQRLSQIQCMTHLPNLQSLNLSNNEIETISGLDRCIYLRDLNISMNCLQKIEGLDRCQHLRSLDISGNVLTSLAGLESLAHLEQLSVQDNRIANLDDLVALEALVELYLANNSLESLRELQKLKQLSNLIILDLVGNIASVNTDPAEYRPYCIFHLPQLKVLDGSGITSAEYYNARDKFAGKVTVDFLAEIIGHEDFPSIYELDLNGCRIRVLESLRRHKLHNLVDLDLSNNALTSIAGLANLKQLTVLRLGKNKLSSPVISSTSTQAASARTAAAKSLTGQDRGFTGLHLCSLEVLDLSYNQLGDIETLGLMGLTELKVLHLTSNRIVKINGLDGCRELQHLVMDKNSVRHLDAAGFALNHKLKIFRAQENGMKTMANLDTMVACETLVLGSNRVSDFKVLEQLALMPKLADLTLTSQAIARKQNYRLRVLRHLFNLQVLDGTPVTDDERARLLGMQGINAQNNPYLYEQQQAALAAAAAGQQGYAPSLYDPHQHNRGYASQTSKAPSVSITTINMDRNQGRHAAAAAAASHAAQAAANVLGQGYAQPQDSRLNRHGSSSSSANGRGTRHTVYTERGSHVNSTGNRSSGFHSTTEQQRALFAQSVLRQQRRAGASEPQQQYQPQHAQQLSPAQAAGRYRSLRGNNGGGKGGESNNDASHSNSRLSSFGIRSDQDPRSFGRVGASSSNAGRNLTIRRRR